MILVGERLYLNRMWCNECSIADFFAVVNQPLEVDENRLRQALDDLFQPSDDINWQKVAAAVALTRRVSVISGGHGTGKTTTVAKLLAALVQMADGARCRICLAAPTGKAAARLTESLGAALRQLPLTDKQRRRYLMKPVPCIVFWARCPVANGCVITLAIHCIWMCWWWMKLR